MLTKKTLLKQIDKADKNAAVVVECMAPDGAYDWVLEDHNVRIKDKGNTIVLFKVRVRKALPARVICKAAVPTVDGLSVDEQSLFKLFYDYFQVSSDDMEQLYKMPREQVMEWMVATVRWNIEEMTRYLGDLLRLLNIPKLTAKYNIDLDVTKNDLIKTKKG